MGVIKLGDGYYFMYIALALLYGVTLTLLLKGRSRKCAHAVLFLALSLNFALHFVKQAFSPYYEGYPLWLRKSTLENICAVSTVFFPFIFMMKKQNPLHDFMFFIGLCGGLGALFYPTEAIGKAPFAFDTLRFYFCHTNLVAVPLVAAILDIYRPRLKYFWTIPLIFLAWEAIICVNEICLVGFGLIEGNISDLLDPWFRGGICNNSFTFGVRSDFAWAKQVFDPMVPLFLRTDAFHINGGTPFYFPVLWLTVPAFVFLIPIYLIFALPFAFFKPNPRRDLLEELHAVKRLKKAKT